MKGKIEGEGFPNKQARADKERMLSRVVTIGEDSSGWEEKRKDHGTSSHQILNYWVMRNLMEDTEIKLIFVSCLKCARHSVGCLMYLFI